jgi:DNA primase
MRWMGQSPTLPPVAHDLMEHTYRFYQRQLAQSEEARAYLESRGIYDGTIIERMRIGYAPGACLRLYLNRLGYGPDELMQSGLMDACGRDTFFRSVTFPLPQTANLYGRSLAHPLCRHRFLPGSKGGLYGWPAAPASSGMIVVEGLFDVAALWQARFHQAVAALGSHLNHRQLSELQSAGQPLYLCFDADRNGSGQRAARNLSIQLRHGGVEALRVELPWGYDPASFFAAGATAADFQRCLNEARP